MNPFKLLATSLATFLVDFRAKMNPVLASLPPLESIEASDPVLSVIRTAKWAMKDAEDMAASFDGKVSQVEDMLSKFAKDSGEAAITAAIHRYVCASPSALVMIQADDLAGETMAVNLPGTDRTRPNWRRKLSVDVGALWQTDAGAQAIADFTPARTGR